MSVAKWTADNYGETLNFLYKALDRMDLVGGDRRTEAHKDAMEALNKAIGLIEDLQYEAAMEFNAEKDAKEFAEYNRLKAKFG